MSIKNLKPSKTSRFKQGYFKGAKKYFGNEPIIYRSSWEYKFMINLELNPKVERWSSENIQIPYIITEKKNGKTYQIRRIYNMDFDVYMKDGKRFIIEIKPSNQAPLNEAQIRTNPVMYKNACKWKAALEWAKFNGCEFKILTEKQLNI